MSFTPIMLIHLLTAGAAVVVGGLVFLLKKGTPLHRLLGRTWALLMLTTALVSFGIRTSGHFSWIHLLSVVTLVGLVAAVFAAANGRVAAHRRGMTSLYIGLVVAGVFTLLPGRRLGHLVWHAAGLI